MKTPTKLELIVTLSELKGLIKKMEENEKHDPPRSNELALHLCEDSFYECLTIDKDELATQYSSQKNCEAINFSITDIITTK